MKKIVVKIGTNVITRPDRLLDQDAIFHLVDQVAQLRQKGLEVILISSGAVGAGRGLIQLPEGIDRVVARQVLAAVGQPHLMQVYSNQFARHNLHCAQVLATKEDFRDRQHYLNMKNCFLALLRDNIVPVVNENDVVSVSELMFTDNDELAGLVASMSGADALIILSSVDGILSAPPGQPDSAVIRTIDVDDKRAANFITNEKSAFGRGGMMTKYRFACQAAKSGIQTWIANGKTPNILLQLVDGTGLGTQFMASRPLNNLKKWMAYQATDPKGTLVINEGAVVALTRGQAVSLLPVGVVRIEGIFERGDLLRIVDEQNQPIGVGIAQYSAAVAVQCIGQRGKRALVHYDYLYLENRSEGVHPPPIPRDV